MHQLRCADDFGAVDVPDGLMTQAHAEDRRGDLGERTDRVADDSARLGSARTGRQQDAVGCERHRLGDGHLVVAHHDRVGAELAEVLDEVVDEAVIAVDDEHAHRRSLP